MEHITAWAYRENRGQKSSERGWTNSDIRLLQFVRALKPSQKPQKKVSQNEALAYPDGTSQRILVTHDQSTNQAIAVDAFCKNAIAYLLGSEWGHQLQTLGMCFIPNPSKNPSAPLPLHTNPPSIYMAEELARRLKNMKFNTRVEHLISWNGLGSAHEGASRKPEVLCKHVSCAEGLEDGLFPVLVDDVVTSGSQLRVCAEAIEIANGVRVDLALCGAATLRMEDEPTWKWTIRELPRFSRYDILAQEEIDF